MRLRTGTAAARTQLAANRAFAQNYRAEIAERKTHPRLLVTAFGRFRQHDVNAAALVAAALVPGLKYPDTYTYDDESVRDPERETTRADATIVLGDDLAIAARGLILPVFWDVAPIVVAREIEAFAPDVVLMTGVAADVQPIFLESSASNLAKPEADATGHLAPASAHLEDDAPDAIDLAFPYVAAATAVGGIRIEKARPENAYLCNALSYQIALVLADRGRSRRLLRGADDGGVDVAIAGDFGALRRTFLHLPAAIRGAEIEAVAATILTIARVAFATK